MAEEGRNPFDGGFGTGRGSSGSGQRSRNQPQPQYSGQRSRNQPQPQYSGQTSGWGLEHEVSGGQGLNSSGVNGDEVGVAHLTQEQKAIRRMEDSSANALRTVNDTYRMGVDTVQELDNQADTLDRIETRVDEMYVDLDKSKQNVRKIKSPFAGVGNWFSRKKTVDEVVNPKGFKPTPAKSSTTTSTKKSTKSGPAQLQQYESTGSEIVDNNLDEMSRQLDKLMNVGEDIGVQLDDSNVQVERISHKVERNDARMKGITRDIKKQL